MLSLEFEKNKSDMLMSKSEMEREFKRGCDVFALVVVKENDDVQEILEVMKPI